GRAAAERGRRVGAQPCGQVRRRAAPADVGARARERRVGERELPVGARHLLRLLLRLPLLRRLRAAAEGLEPAPGGVRALRAARAARRALARLRRRALAERRARRVPLQRPLARLLARPLPALE